MTQYHEDQYWETNKEWYYIDIRCLRSKLTDKATKKAMQSYLDDYLPQRFPNKTWEERYDYLRKDINDYEKNKHRYTIEKDEFGINYLTKVDGIDVTLASLDE